MPASRSPSIVGAGVGGGYDHQARLVARHLGKHIPGNPGDHRAEHAGGRRHRRDQLHVQHAPKDGTMIALVQRGMLLAKLTYPGGTRFEIEKFHWLSSLNSETAVTLAWNATSHAPHRQGPARQGTDRRRHRRRRSGDDAEALQLADRNQVQGRQRLQQHRRDRARDRARRGPGHRRLFVVEPQGRAAALDERKEDHDADAGRAQERA